MIIVFAFMSEARNRGLRYFEDMRNGIKES